MCGLYPDIFLRQGDDEVVPEDFRELSLKLFEAIGRENESTARQAWDLPDETTLSSEAESVFGELREYWATRFPKDLSGNSTT
ncbi:MAG: hypothetical protein NTV81_01655 [Candidatus Komeilibacteria bacterium]|nr:hypothetical protein [Candidatus Komeilibacteria bacterium]